MAFVIIQVTFFQIYKTLFPCGWKKLNPITSYILTTNKYPSQLYMSVVTRGDLYIRSAVDHHEVCPIGDFIRLDQCFLKIKYPRNHKTVLSSLYSVFCYLFPEFALNIFESRNPIHKNFIDEAQTRIIDDPVWLEMGFQILIKEEMKHYPLTIATINMFETYEDIKGIGFAILLNYMIPQGNAEKFKCTSPNDKIIQVQYGKVTCPYGLLITGNVVNHLLHKMGILFGVCWPRDRNFMVHPNALWMEFLLEEYFAHCKEELCPRNASMIINNQQASLQTAEPTTQTPIPSQAAEPTTQTPIPPQTAEPAPSNQLPEPYYTKAPGDTVIKLPTGVTAIEILPGGFDLFISSKSQYNMKILSDKQLRLISLVNNNKQPHAVFKISGDTSILALKVSNFYYRVLFDDSTAYKSYSATSKSKIKFITTPTKFYYDSSITSFAQVGEDTPIENIKMFVVNAEFIEKNKWFNPKIEGGILEY